jgi:hypothetical protein
MFAEMTQMFEKVAKAIVVPECQNMYILATFERPKPF